MEREVEDTEKNPANLCLYYVKTIVLDEISNDTCLEKPVLVWHRTATKRCLHLDVTYATSTHLYHFTLKYTAKVRCLIIKFEWKHVHCQSLVYALWLVSIGR